MNCNCCVFHDIYRDMGSSCDVCTFHKNLVDAINACNNSENCHHRLTIEEAKKIVLAREGNEN